MRAVGTQQEFCRFKVVLVIVSVPSLRDGNLNSKFFYQ